MPLKNNIVINFLTHTLLYVGAFIFFGGMSQNRFAGPKGGHFKIFNGYCQINFQKYINLHIHHQYIDYPFLKIGMLIPKLRGC